MFPKILKYITYLFLGYLFIGFVLLPLLIKPQLVKLINTQTNAEVTINSLGFNPILFQVTIDVLNLQDRQQNKLVGFESLRVNVDPSALIKGSFKLKELSLIDPYVNIVYNKDKRLNLSKILKPQKVPVQNDAEDQSSSALPHIIVELIDVKGGSVSFRDDTHREPFEFSFANLGFTLKEFDTQKIEKKNAKIRFYSRLSDGGFIDLKTTMLSLEPLKFKGTVDFEASKLYTEWKYMQDELNLEVADGKVSFSLAYDFNFDDINATKIKNLHLALEKLRIKPKNRDKDILNLDSLALSGITILPMQQYVDISTFNLHGLRVKAKRLDDGKIDWIEYLKVKSSSEAKSTKSTKTSKTTPKPWDVILHTLAIEDVNLAFYDKAIKPAVESKIDNLNIYADDITLLGEKPFAYKVDMLINSATKCMLNGKVAHKKLDLTTHMECKDFDVVHYRPYITKAARSNLKRYDILLQSTFVDMALDAKIYEKNKEYITYLNNTNIIIKKLLVRKKSTKERLVAFQDLKLNGIELDTQTKDVNVSAITFNRVVANVTRKKSGKLNVDGLVLTKAVKHVRKKVKRKEKPYRVKIKSVVLNNAKLNFTDRVLPKKQRHTIDRIYVKVNNIDSKRGTWLNYRASLRINKKGKLSAYGKLRHTPLKQRGSLKAKNIALADATPYLQESSYVSIDDGQLSFSLKEQYAKSKKSPDISLNGSVKLNSLFVTDTNDDNSSLLSMNELEVKPFTLELFPNRLYVDSILVDSFYISAKIDENKTLNFAKLAKPTLQNESQESNISKEQNASDAFPVSIVKIDVQNGSAEFQDYSLPIKFRTNIHDLQGIVYAVSNTPGGTTYLNLDGEVDKYGSTKLKGSVDSFNPKEYTDLDFDFKNLNLPGMSGYSATFAGYEIESGKLYLDLGYDIMYGKLRATNNIMIKHMKLGKELEGEGINHLPLGFVIGLLEDGEGIIDIDMPIEGNVNEPDFKYGALVWKTMGNLIAKAVTSPFKFLGSAMGISGDELEYIAFEFGKSNITPPEREKLDKIAKMMNKRPKISLEIPATYDEVKDLDVLQMNKLVSMIMKMSGDENTKNARTALTIEMLEDVYNKLRDDDTLEKLQEKLKEKYTKDETYARAYQKELIKICSAIQKVEPQALQALARKRSETIQSYLVREQGILKSRVKVGDIHRLNKENEKELQVELKIEVQSRDK